MAVRRARAKPKVRRARRVKTKTRTRPRAKARAKGGGGGTVCIQIPRSGAQAICRTGPRMIIITGNNCV